MQKLIEITKKVLQEKEALPFSVYSSTKNQHILNVPVIKPLAIFVLSGNKSLGTKQEIVCPSGNFVFLSNTPTITMRNIPDIAEYFALLVEFDYADFDCLQHRNSRPEKYFQGPIDSILENTLIQFVEWSVFSPNDIWSFRRQEILRVIEFLGFKKVGSVMEPVTLSHKVHSIISVDTGNDVSAQSLCSVLAMSESTLRRKLSAEGTSLQEIKDRVRLGHGLHLVQTTFEPIGLIAEKCGYSSQSRFTDKFKQLFDITPTELRKTRLTDSGE